MKKILTKLRSPQASGPSEPATESVDLTTSRTLTQSRAGDERSLLQGSQALKSAPVFLFESDDNSDSSPPEEDHQSKGEQTPSSGEKSTGKQLS